MTKSCGDRIFISEFIKILENVNFDELTEERCKKLFVDHNFQWVNQFNETSKDIAIDDYVFTVHLINGNEYCFNGFKINDMILSSDVEVWLPSDNCGGVDIQGNGTIKCRSNIYYMTVDYVID